MDKAVYIVLTGEVQSLLSWVLHLVGARNGSPTCSYDPQTLMGGWEVGGSFSIHAVTRQMRDWEHDSHAHNFDKTKQSNKQNDLLTYHKVFNYNILIINVDKLSCI